MITDCVDRLSADRYYGVHIQLSVATPQDVSSIASLRTAAAEALTALHGDGPWSSTSSERSVLFEMKRGTIYLARCGNQIIATLILSVRKPWAIDAKHFCAVKRPLYLTAMTVAPALQRTGVGRACLEHVRTLAKEWPADSIRLDAWDADAGAGEFYRKCGYREVARVIYRNAALIYFELLIEA